MIIKLSKLVTQIKFYNLITLKMCKEVMTIQFHHLIDHFCHTAPFCFPCLNLQLLYHCELKWSEVAQSCPALCDPWTVAHQAPPSMGFSRQECWSGLPFPSPGDLPDPGIKPSSLILQADALTSAPPGKPFVSLWFPFFFNCIYSIISKLICISFGTVIYLVHLHAHRKWHAKSRLAFP